VKGLFVRLRLAGPSDWRKTDFPNRSRTSPHINARQAFVVRFGGLETDKYFVYDPPLTMMPILVEKFRECG
jgi:hypothetical protein